MNNTKYSKISISEWKQFSQVEIEFHSSATILTGANGSGKTTILNILGRQHNHSELSTPARNEDSKSFSFVPNVPIIPKLIDIQYNYEKTKIGEIQYSTGNTKNLLIINANANNPAYTIYIEGQENIYLLNISSHRPLFSYRQVSNISTVKKEIESAWQPLSAFDDFFRTGQNYGSLLQPANFFIKETLLNWAIGGSGNEYIEAESELKENYDGFITVLSKVLPKTLGFKTLAIRRYEVILVTETGDFMLDAVSGGVAAIIDLAWKIYCFYRNNSGNVTVLIDEIENHLHATLQREILPNLIDAFPNIQFIVTSHSPLVIGSVKDSFVYVLRYDDVKKVYSEKLDLFEKSKTANDILNEVLGVPFTMPIWIENKLMEIVERYKALLTPESFSMMRDELKSIGLEDLMPTAIEKVLTDNTKNDDSNK